MAISGGDGSIILNTRVDTSGINKGMTSIKSAVTKVGTAIGVAFSVSALINFGKEAVNLASDLQEVQNVVDTAFGSMSYKIEEFSKTAIEQFGISQLTAKRTASTYMAMAKGMGIAEDVASDMAITMTGLTADIASFYNMSQERADVILKSVYTGETESLKQLGIVMTEVNLEQFALSKGITKNISAMTQQEKTMLRYQFVLEQTRLAQGDFAKTSDSWANQTRILAERWKEMQAVWGQAFMGLATIALPTINNIISGLTRVGQVAQVAAQWIYKAFTGKNLEIQSANKQAEAIGGVVENQENLTEAVKDTEEAQKKALLGFDELNQLTKNTTKNAEDLTDSLLKNNDLNNLEFKESEKETFNLSKFDELLARLEPIAVLVASIGAGLLAWQISKVTKEGIITFLANLIKVSGILMIIAGSLLLVMGYSDAWVNGINWNNLTQIFNGLALLVAGVALAISPIAAAFVSLGAGVAIVILAFKDMVENGLNVQNVLTAILGIIITVTSALVAMGKLSFFATLLPLLALIAGAFLTIKGATDAWVNGVDWNNLALMISGVAIAITAVAVSSDLLYTSITMIIGGITLFVIGLRDLINNGVNAKNAILLIAGAVTTLIGGAMLLSSILNLSLNPAVYISVGGFAALFAGVIAVASAWEKMSTLERAVSVLGLLAIAAASAAAAVGALQSALTMGIAAAAIVAGIVAVVASINSATKEAENSVMSLNNTSFGANMADFKMPQLPKLARGAVIPPNKEFMAILGDQKQGTNVEAPLDTIKQAVADVIGGMGIGGQQSVTLELDGYKLARTSVPYWNNENRRLRTRLQRV